MADYDYLQLGLARGAAASARFVQALAAIDLGGQPLGLFTAQLGWEASQVALLIAGGEGASPAAASLAQAPEVLSCVAWRLSPTVRPAPGARLQPGGIYVHRWFEVAAASFDAFVALSAEAWPDFESRFDAQVFGLFEATGGPSPAVADRRRLLLITRYASHGVWEDSRDPSTAAMQTFARRAELTLATSAASSLLVAL
jgi:hypothetical protein